MTASLVMNACTCAWGGMQINPASSALATDMHASVSFDRWPLVGYYEDSDSASTRPGGQMALEDSENGLVVTAFEFATTEAMNFHFESDGGSFDGYTVDVELSSYAWSLRTQDDDGKPIPAPVFDQTNESGAFRVSIPVQSVYSGTVQNWPYSSRIGGSSAGTLDFVGNLIRVGDGVELRMVSASQSTAEVGFPFGTVELDTSSRFVLGAQGLVTPTPGTIGLFALASLQFRRRRSSS